MTQIKIKKARIFPSGEQFFPITHTKAVIDDNGYTAESRLGAMQDEINNLQEGVVVVGEGMTPVPSDLAPTEDSANWVTSGGVYNALQNIQTDVTELAGGLHKFIGLTASITIPAALPAGYTILDYIANTSSSGGYIDTGIKPNDSNWKFEGSWMLTGAIETYQAIMASYSVDTANSYRVIYNNTSTTSVLISANTKAFTSSSVNGANEWNTFSIQYGTATINGTVVTLGTTAGTAITNNMCLFSNTAATKFLVGKMRRFKAWHSGTLVRDMIPCINPQSVYGMYDIVNDVFYGSSNANSFTGGN